MLTDGPSAVLLVGEHEGEPHAALQLVAETEDPKGSYGHAALVTESGGGQLDLGANDVDAVLLRYQDGKPSLVLTDAQEAELFRAP